MEDYILVDILDNLDPNLIETVNVDKDMKKDKRQSETLVGYWLGYVFGLNKLKERIANKNSFFIDNFEVEKAIADEERRQIEIKAFGRAVSHNESSDNFRISIKKKKLVETKVFKITTAIASLCIGIIGVLTLIIKIKHSTNVA